MNSYYYDREFTPDLLHSNEHRNSVGGVWEEQGELQLSLCKKYGLTPVKKLLDFGCGCLRGGVRLIEFLDKGNYYGIDVNTGLLKAGIEYEIPKVNLQEKLVRDNFLITDLFEVDFFKVQFDMIIAQSVFTHLSLNHYCYFLEKCYPVLHPNGKLIISFWLVDETHRLSKNYCFTSSNFSMNTSHIFDSYFCKLSQLKKLTGDEWNLDLLDDTHPRQQQFILLTKK